MDDIETMNATYDYINEALLKTMAPFSPYNPMACSSNKINFLINKSVLYKQSQQKTDVSRLSSGPHQMDNSRSSLPSVPHSKKPILNIDLTRKITPTAATATATQQSNNYSSSMLNITTKSTTNKTNNTQYKERSPRKSTKPLSNANHSDLELNRKNINNASIAVDLTVVPINSKFYDDNLDDEDIDEDIFEKLRLNASKRTNQKMNQNNQTLPLPKKKLNNTKTNDYANKNTEAFEYRNCSDDDDWRL